MTQSIQLGTVHGIPVRIHPSLALVLVWVAYQWGISARAGLPGVVFGICVMLAIFGCVLVHELGHAVASLHYGMSVRDITLLPFGGVARMEYVSLRPGAETVIALAGPAVNVIIAIFLAPVIAVIARIRGLHFPMDILLGIDELSVVGFILYVWVANILLAVFNLIPAFPMDGGRVLRAVLSLIMSRLLATRVAALIGAVFAVILLYGGLVLGDFLIPLVSIFIVAAAYMEYRNVKVESTLRGLPVGQFALWESGGIRPDEPLAHAIIGGPRDLAVTQDGKVVGMLWRHEVLRLLNGLHHDLLVRDIMDRRFNAVEAMDSVYDVHTWLASANQRAVPVVENGYYRGIFTMDRLEHVYQRIGTSEARRILHLMNVVRQRLRAASR